MKNCFGEYSKFNKQFYQTTPLSVLYRLWFDNQDMNNAKMIKVFKKVFTTQPQSWKDATSAGGRKAAQNFYAQAHTALNRHIKFRDDAEAIDLYRREQSTIEAIVPRRR